MYFGSGMTLTIHGIKENFKEEEREKEKEKEDEDFSDQETKEKEREKEKVILLKMRAIGHMMNGKDMKMKIRMKAIGPTNEDETAWQSQGWEEWQEYDEYGYFQGKGKKGKKGKGKGKKGHGPQDQGKGQGDGKGKATYVNPSYSSQPAAQPAALPSSASTSGFFVTHSPVYLTSAKMTENGEQSMEPDFSGCAFLEGGRPLFKG